MLYTIFKDLVSLIGWAFLTALTWAAIFWLDFTWNLFDWGPSIDREFYVLVAVVVVCGLGCMALSFAMSPGTRRVIGSVLIVVALTVLALILAWQPEVCNPALDSSEVGSCGWFSRDANPPLFFHVFCSFVLSFPGLALLFTPRLFGREE